MSNELKKWGKDKPEVGIFVNLYRQGTDYAVFGQVERAGFFFSVKGPHVGESTIPSDMDHWCEVPAPPDWVLALGRRRAQHLVEVIASRKSELEALEEESRTLAEQLEVLETCDAVYNRADFPHGCPICGKEH